MGPAFPWRSQDQWSGLLDLVQKDSQGATGDPGDVQFGHFSGVLDDDSQSLLQPRCSFLGTGNVSSLSQLSEKVAAPFQGGVRLHLTCPEGRSPGATGKVFFEGPQFPSPLEMHLRQ